MKRLCLLETAYFWGRLAGPIFPVAITINSSIRSRAILCRSVTISRLFRAWPRNTVGHERRNNPFLNGTYQSAAESIFEYFARDSREWRHRKNSGHCSLFRGLRGIARLAIILLYLCYGDLLRKINVLNRVQQLDAFVHRPLECFAAGDQAHAAAAFVDDGGAHRLGEIAGAF